MIPTSASAAIAAASPMAGEYLESIGKSDLAVLTEADAQGHCRGLAHLHRPFDRVLRAALLALNTAGSDELHRAALAQSDEHLIKGVHACWQEDLRAPQQPSTRPANS